ncbi:MAG: MerR family transcriptional regulator, partial [Oxalobacteraceae bacterium]|nr:MerR family transcriptional regulator [Oxalobacteraceae bacterium]
MVAELTISKLVEAAGVNIETIRYYQRHGLLDAPAKPFGGHRRYSPEQAKRVRFINTLAAAHTTGNLKREMSRYLKPRILLIDELGYLPIDKFGADALFQ